MSRTILTVFVFALLATCSLCADVDNVALNKPTTQSSEFLIRIYSASLAVNGDYKDFTHTDTDGVKWWRVDLQGKYVIARILLHNRPKNFDRLSQITVMTSNAATPTKLSVGYEGWTNRSYQGPAYGAVGVIDFPLPIAAQHVAVVSENIATPLSLAEVVITEKWNIAYNKPAIQSSTFKEYKADRAVNGNYGDFTHTTVNETKWWKVDLQDKYTIGTIELHNRAGFFDRLSQITVMTSNAVTPTNLSVSYEDWTNRSYQGPAYGAVGVIDFTSPIEAQHVAVVSENIAADLSLAEVVVHEYNYARDATASQSSTYSSSYPAEKAIDRDISSFSHTLLVENAGSQWWMMESKIRYLFQRAVVYVRDGQCVNAMCSSHLSDIFLLTNSKDNGVAPNTNGEGGWNVCYHSPTALGDSFERQFEQGITTPVTKMFSIFTQTGRSVELREVMVYGKALPQLPDDIGLTVNDVTFSSIEISFNGWTEDMDGYLPPSSYTIAVADVNSQTITPTSNSRRLSYNWTNLMPGTSYTFTVTCRIQDLDCPGPQPQFTASTDNCSAPGNFSVSVNPSRSTDNGKRKWKIQATWTAPTANCIEEMTYNYQVNDEELHTTASTSVEFYVDGESDYKLTVWAINYQGLSSTVSALARTEALGTASVSRSSDISRASAGEIAGAVVGTTVGLLIAAVIVFLIWRWGRSSLPPGNNNEHVLSVVTTRASDSTDGQRSHNYTNLATEKEEAPKNDSIIPVEGLQRHITENADRIMRQFQVLKSLPAPECSVALLPENKNKTRYLNLNTSDSHRVVLQTNKPSDTDFINATYMLGYFHERQYIASVGPFNDQVLQDFWFMIWQEKPSAILMLTQLIEETKMKCKQYWPQEVNKIVAFGDIAVKLLSVDESPDFIVRRLAFTKRGETREISHILCTSWSDHDIPSMELLACFQRTVKSIIGQNKSAPLLVHCSAGVGRTGTYIALDYLLNQAKAEQMVDPFGFVKKMRARRPCMVQTEDQYMFLHQVLCESIAISKFTCTPADLDAKISQHGQRSTSLITQEYEHVTARVRALDLPYEMAKEAENRSKNRFPDNLPSDRYMLHLEHGLKGNYVNAVIVHSWKVKGKWIATQLPLADTVSDFWQLVMEQDIKIVVQLEEAQNGFYPPSDCGVLSVKPFKITRVSSETSEIVNSATLKLQTAKKVEEVVVLTVKSSQSKQVPSPFEMVSLQMAVEKLQLKTASRKVCVTCLDGTTKSGLYICAHNAIEKLNAEPEVNIYYPTVTARLRRPQFIPTMDQYVLLYQTVKDYIDRFSTYGNFN